MRLSGYIKLDQKYKKSMENYDTKNLGIGMVGMFLFCTFVLAGAMGMMDHIIVFNIYVACFLVSSSLYFWPLIHVKERNGIVSIFKKFQSVPINKKQFIRAKLIILIRFSVLFCIPIQVMHYIGLMRTETSQISMIGFWPLIATVITICVQYLYMRLQSNR